MKTLLLLLLSIPASAQRLAVMENLAATNNAIFVGTTTPAVGINTATPGATLEVNGTAQVDSTLTVVGYISAQSSMNVVGSLTATSFVGGGVAQLASPNTYTSSQTVISTISASYFVGNGAGITNLTFYSSQTYVSTMTNSGVGSNPICASTVTFTTHGGLVVLSFTGTAEALNGVGYVCLGVLVNGAYIFNETNDSYITCAGLSISASIYGQANMSFSQLLSGIPAGSNSFCLWDAASALGTPPFWSYRPIFSVYELY